MMRSPSLPYNTEELLLACLQKDLSDKLKTRAQELIKEGVDWERFIESATRGGVTILAYNGLKKLIPDTYLPKFAFEQLKSSYIFMLSKAALQDKELTGLLKLFARNNIAVMPLKGVIISERLYGDIAAHGLSVDFDLLVKEEGKKKAAALLEGAGYSLSPNGEIKRWQWQYDFQKPEATSIDLHWDITLACRSKKRIEGFWDGARHTQRNGVSFFELKEEGLLLYLSSHAVNSDAFRQLRYICDINELLHKHGSTINWDSVIGRAKDWRLSSSLYAALILCKRLLASPIPDTILNGIKPTLAKRLFINFFANKKVILRDCRRRKIMDRFLSYVFFELIEARNSREYLTIIKRVFFPPKEVLLAAKYGDAKPLFIRYLLRLFKGASRVLGTG